MERRNVRLIGGPCDGQVIELIVEDESKPRPKLSSAICYTEVVYAPSGYFEPLTGYEHYRWEKTEHHEPPPPCARCGSSGRVAALGSTDDLTISEPCPDCTRQIASFEARVGDFFEDRCSGRWALISNAELLAKITGSPIRYSFRTRRAR